MGTGDLNLLKSWNPRLVKNREKVWKKQQELLKEDEKVKQRQQEIQKEKEMETLLQGADKAGAKKQNSLSWMYEDPKSSTMNKDVLLGKKKIDPSLLKKKSSATGGKVSNSKVVKPKKKYDYSKDDPMSKIKLHKK